MGIMEGGMNWNQMKEIVERQLNKLAMCKRGSIATDINLQKEKMGDKPRYNDEERKEIRAGLEAKVKKAMTPTMKDVKKYTPHELGRQLIARGDKVLKGIYTHPDAKAWDDKRDLINKQAEERNAQLDGDVQDIIDQFTLGVTEVEEFPAIRDAFEAKEW